MHKKFKDRIKDVKDKTAQDIKASVKLDIPDDDLIETEGTAIVSVIMTKNNDVEVVIGGYMSPEDLAYMMSSVLETINDEVIPSFKGESDDELH